MAGVDVVTLAIAKKYTKKTIEGAGAVKGSPCTIKQITPVEGGNKVTFEWELTDGTKQTMDMIVNDGTTPHVWVEPATGGNNIFIQDATGTTECFIADGFSPSVTITDIP